MDQATMSHDPEYWREQDYRINTYQCQLCKTMVTTVDVNHGVTPAKIGCAKKGCMGSNESAMYPLQRPIPYDVPYPIFEWYVPPANTKCSEIANTKEQFDKSIEHLKMGGLLIRKLKTPESEWIRHSDNCTPAPPAPQVLPANQNELNEIVRKSVRKRNKMSPILNIKPRRN